MCFVITAQGLIYPDEDGPDAIQQILATWRDSSPSSLMMYSLLTECWMAQWGPGAAQLREFTEAGWLAFPISETPPGREQSVTPRGSVTLHSSQLLIPYWIATGMDVHQRPRTHPLGHPRLHTAARRRATTRW